MERDGRPPGPRAIARSACSTADPRSGPRALLLALRQASPASSAAKIKTIRSTRRGATSPSRTTISCRRPLHDTVDPGPAHLQVDQGKCRVTSQIGGRAGRFLDPPPFHWLVGNHAAQSVSSLIQCFPWQLGAIFRDYASTDASRPLTIGGTPIQDLVLGLLQTLTPTAAGGGDRCHCVARGANFRRGSPVARFVAPRQPQRRRRSQKTDAIMAGGTSRRGD